MAANQTQSLLLQTFGGEASKAHNEIKGAEKKYDTGGDLPANVRGVAQLVSMQFKKIEKGKKNEGKLVFFAAGIVKKPKEHDGIPIEGCRTSIIENIFDTPQATGKNSRRTWKEHLAWVYNVLKVVFNVKVEEMSVTEIEQAMVALVRKKPQFTFRTWKGEKQKTGPYKDMEPRVNHVWIGPVTDEEVKQANDDDVQDDSPPSDEDHASPSEMVDDDTDDTVTASHDDSDVEISDDDAESSDEEQGEEQEEEETPKYKAGQNYSYAPLNKETGKREKAVACEIIQVNEDGTVDLKNVANPVKKYRKVKTELLKSV